MKVKLITLFFIIMLLASLYGCSQKTIPTTQAIDQDLEVPENDLALPDQTLTNELTISDEPAFSSVI